MAKLIASALLALMLVGCAQQDMSDLDRYVTEVKARPPAPIAPIPQIRQAETYLYIAGDRRDPFQPEAESAEGVEMAAGGGLQPDLNRPKEELESFSLDNLSMVGTLAQQNDLWALVKTPDGTIHRAREGNYMGRNYGRIVTISEDKIDVRELIPDGKGSYMEREASLTIGER